MGCLMEFNNMLYETASTMVLKLACKGAENHFHLHCSSRLKR
jgi:hypothetical protein